MRTIPMSEDEEELHGEAVQMADWKAPPEEVLKSVDELLEPHGLEIVQYDTQDDSYLFRIERRMNEWLKKRLLAMLGELTASSHDAMRDAIEKLLLEMGVSQDEIDAPHGSP